MIEIIILLGILFFILAYTEKDKNKAMIMILLSIFINFGGYKLSYDGTNYMYAYLPLAFMIVSVFYGIYILYEIITIETNKNFDTEIENLE